MGNVQRREVKESSSIASSSSSNNNSRNTSTSVYEPEGNLLYKPQADAAFESKWQTKYVLKTLMTSAERSLEVLTSRDRREILNVKVVLEIPQRVQGEG
jgi:hypothetical protein